MFVYCTFAELKDTLHPSNLFFLSLIIFKNIFSAYLEQPVPSLTKPDFFCDSSLVTFLIKELLQKREYNRRFFSLTTSLLGELLHFSFSYDFASIMHYGMLAFSMNGKPSIEPLDTKVDASVIGQRSGFSDLDIIELNEAFKVSSLKVNYKLFN